MRLTLRLTAVIVFGICLIQIGNGILRVQRETAAFEKDMRSDHQTEGAALGHLIAVAWREQGMGEALRLINEVNDARGVIHLRWMWLDAPAATAEGIKTPPDVLAGLAPDHPVFWKDKTQSPGFFRSYFLVDVPGGRRGGMELSESLAALKAFTRGTQLRIVATTVVITFLAAILSVVFGFLLVGRPMRAMVKKARRIGSGDFSEPLVSYRSDEVGQLAYEINLMNDRLRTARENLEAETGERLKVLAQLRHADRLSTVGKLAAGMAHELGTPLNVISGRAKMCLRGELEAAELRDSAQVIVEQTDRMTMLIRQLLDFSRQRKLERVHTDLNQMVSRTLIVLGTLAARQKVVLEGKDSGKPVYAEVDAIQMQQVVTNLVLNGIQAMPEGGTLSVEVIPSHPARRPIPGSLEIEAACIRVRDQGKGIPPEVIDHIFEPFFTTKGTGEGSGLGLSVSYGLVEEHGGWFDVHSETGKGSLFSVYLPVRSRP
ncbi:MAG: ATP-binding protein [Pseudomonadota bacterium]